MGAARAELESLLRARKLDVTLTTAAPWETTPDAADDRLAPTGWDLLDRRLAGGLRRGHVSELVGSRSSGRTTVCSRMLAAATGRGEVAALVDTHDRFDPVSAEAAGVDLARVLWIRGTGDAERALKAMNLVVQAGGFGLVVFDVADVRPLVLRQFPHTTWMRIARVIEGSTTAALLIASEHVARSPGGVTIVLQPPDVRTAGEWSGDTARARRLRGLSIDPRIVSSRAHL